MILASSSPRRRELLATLGVSFDVLKPDVDETQHDHEAPIAYVRRLSRAKAHAAQARLAAPHAILAADTTVILAADTIGITDMGEILGKPANAIEAHTMLVRLRERGHVVVTAFTLLTESIEHTQHVLTRVTMRNYSDAEIADYVASGDPFDKAGGYAIQHEGFRPVARIDGSYTNVVGLPIEAVTLALRCAGLLP